MPTAGVASSGISGMGYFGFSPIAKEGQKPKEKTG